MARFELQPCKVRGTRVVPTKEPMLVIESLPELIERFCKNPSPIDRQRIQEIKRDVYIGTTKGSLTGKDTMFLLLNHNRASNDFAWVTKGNSDALDNLKEVFKVIDVRWDAKFVELGLGGSPA